jgi:hypothetical protein
MAELNELERRLSDLRGDLAVMLREGCTPTQFLKLQRDLIHAWAAVEEHKARHLPTPAVPAVMAGEIPGQGYDAVAPNGSATAEAEVAP